MKGVYLMGKRSVFWFLCILLIAFSLMGCANTSDVKTGSQEYDEGKQAKTEETAKESPPPENIKKVNINKSYAVGGLEIIIGEIKVESEQVLIGITIKNTSQAKLSFYPDQGNIVIGSTQLDANMFMGEGDVSGDIHPGVEKSGVIVFTAPEGKSLSPKEITEISLHWGDVMNSDTYNTSPFDTKITLQ